MAISPTLKAEGELPWLEYKTQDPVLLASTFGPGPQANPKAPEAPPPQAKPEKESTTAEKAIYPYRWENGLDLLLTSLFGKSATKLESPSLIGEALWSYKFRTGTYLGGILLGSLQSMAVEREGAKLDFTLYHVGPYIGQDLWRYEHFRLLASLAFGKGSLFVRRTPAFDKATMHRGEYQFVEPGLSFVVYQTQTLDIGLVANYRHVTLAEPVTTNLVDPLNPDGPPIPLTVAADQDIRGMAFGVTFRSTTF